MCELLMTFSRPVQKNGKIMERQERARECGREQQKMDDKMDGEIYEKENAERSWGYCM